MDPMLGAAIVSLLVGPLLGSLWPRGQAWRAVMDGLALTLVGGLCLLYIVPHAIQHGGFLAVGAGIALVLGSRVLVQRIPSSARWLPAVLVSVLGIHAALDGAALAVIDHSHGGALGLAIAAHRLPVGLAVFMGAVAQGRAKWGWLAVGGLAVATVAGFGVGVPLADLPPPWAIGMMEAAVGAALLHIVTDPSAHGSGHGHSHDHSHDHSHGMGVAEPPGHVAHEAPHHHTHDHNHDHGGVDHHSHTDHAHPAHTHGPPGQDHPGTGHRPQDAPADLGLSRGWSSVGACVGLLAIIAIALEDADHHADPASTTMLTALVDLTLASAPALLIGYVLAGLITSFVDPSRVARMAGGTRLTQALRGVVVGLPMPVCSCGVLPLYEGLVRRGLPISAGLAFLVATPELGLDAVLLSLPLLGPELTIARVLAAFLVALVVALAVRGPQPSPVAAVASAAGRPPLKARLTAGLRFGLVELVDHTLPWVLLGLAVAAVIEPLLGHEALRALPAAAQVPLFALVGVPAYVCASGATPIAAIAVHKGISAGAALAFLIAGPATNVTTFGVLARLHGTRTAVKVGAVILAAAVCVGWGVDTLDLSLPAVLHSQEHPHERPIAVLSTLGLAMLAFSSLLRQGPRGLVGQVTEPMAA